MPLFFNYIKQSEGTQKDPFWRSQVWLEVTRKANIRIWKYLHLLQWHAVAYKNLMYVFADKKTVHCGKWSTSNMWYKHQIYNLSYNGRFVMTRMSIWRRKLFDDAHCFSDKLLSKWNPCCQMRRICIMYIDDGGNVVVVQLTGGQARGLKVANSIDRQGSVALTADGAKK